MIPLFFTIMYLGPDKWQNTIAQIILRQHQACLVRLTLLLHYHGQTIVTILYPSHLVNVIHRHIVLHTHC